MIDPVIMASVKATLAQVEAMIDGHVSGDESRERAEWLKKRFREMLLNAETMGRLGAAWKASRPNVRLEVLQATIQEVLAECWNEVEAC